MLCSMPNQSVGSNDYPLGTTFPAPHPWDAPDPLPVMRREMKLLLIEISKLRVEVERLRAAEQEARYLSASLDQIMESRDQWRREAERLRALIAQVTPWSLLWWRCLDTFRTGCGTAPEQVKVEAIGPLEARYVTHPHDLIRMRHCEWLGSAERLHPAAQIPDLRAKPQQLLHSVPPSHRGAIHKFPMRLQSADSRR